MGNVFLVLYNQIIYRPLLNCLTLIYFFLPGSDLGLAIIGLTLLVRLILHPSIRHTFRTQASLAKIQPKLKEIQQKFKDNREEQTKQTMELYRTHRVNPFSGCLPILIQLPVLIGLYQVFFRGITRFDPALLYSFVPHIQNFNPLALGLVDLTIPSLPLALSSGLTQFFQSRSSQQVLPAGQEDFSRALRWQTTYFFPVLIALISLKLPAALAFYWTISNLFAIVEQRLILAKLAPPNETVK